MSTGDASTPAISLPSGGGALRGIEEKFSPDLHTGTGNFTVPIALPAGRNGLQPRLNLVYSTGSGNGPFGMGWGLDVPRIARKTSTGLPTYYDAAGDESADVFILSGAEDLVPVTTAGSETRYQPRTEGMFAAIRRIRNAGQRHDYWEVRSKDGLTTVYGTPGAAGADPAAVDDPDRAGACFAWHATRIADPFGNHIAFEYDRDRGSQPGRRWNQLYLHRIMYVDDVVASTSIGYLVSITFDYEARPDPFSGHRTGFEIRTARRCTAITIRTHAGQDRLVRRYELAYRNDAPSALSLLSQITLVGFSDAGDADRMPPLQFDYTAFDVSRRRLLPITGESLPAASIGGAGFTLVDVTGNGLPDILELDDAPRYWRNLGGGRFDRPRQLNEDPAGFRLADSGVQFIDANGDGRADLLATTGPVAGYVPMEFGAKWSRRSFVPYRTAPSFDLEDPEVRLLDLDGDGITDALRSGGRFECFFNHRDPAKAWSRQIHTARASSDVFPNVSFTDDRVRCADMSGDGLEDIVILGRSSVEFWPNRGHGRWAPRRRMANAPRLPWDFNVTRVLLGDLDGDGAADLIYVEDQRVTLWLNRGGESWSAPIVIDGTPRVSTLTDVRLADLLGTGIVGVLWSDDATGLRPALRFLAPTGGVKPYLLNRMDNNLGAQTRVTYRPSTYFFLKDQEHAETRWRTPLPFPVQVVAHVEVRDWFSGGRLTTTYRYRDGYWDGDEREFRGFRLVDQLDSESFSDLATSRPDFAPRYYSPPTLTKTWFHQGPVGDSGADWREPDDSQEYWRGDPQLLPHTRQVNAFLRTYSAAPGGVTPRDRQIKRDALRSLRGRILRTELYALDGSTREERPYTVTEHAYALREESPPADPASARPRIFFPHETASRTTQWERGDDPLTTFSFTADFDGIGQPRQQSSLAMPRRTATRRNVVAAVVGAAAPDETRVLATHRLVHYAQPVAGGSYIRDRAWQTHTFEPAQPIVPVETAPGNVARVLADQAQLAQQLHAAWVLTLAAWTPGTAPPAALSVIEHAVNHYDGAAFAGRGDDRVEFGALTRSEQLVFDDAILTAAYDRGQQRRPMYLDGTVTLPAGAPAGFGANLGYRRTALGAGGPYQAGYYADTKRQQRDFQASGTPPHGAAAWPRRGVIVSVKDGLGTQLAMQPDRYWLLVEKATDGAGLETSAVHNYRLLQPSSIADVNGTIVSLNYNAHGLPTQRWAVSADGTEGGTAAVPDVTFTYELDAFARTRSSAQPQPAFVRTTERVWHARSGDGNDTIETMECSDGFGRVIQKRTRAEELAFGALGDQVGLPPAAGAAPGTASGTRIADRVIVSGWQIFDNKGRVVEEYEPYFDSGWRYQPESVAKRGAHIERYYDPRGNAVRTVNPDGAEQRVIYGRPLRPDVLCRERSRSGSHHLRADAVGNLHVRRQRSRADQPRSGSAGGRCTTDAGGPRRGLAPLHADQRHHRRARPAHLPGAAQRSNRGGLVPHPVDVRRPRQSARAH